MSADPLVNLLINYLCWGFGKSWNRNLTHNISLGHLLCFKVVRRQKFDPNLCGQRHLLCWVLHTEHTIRLHATHQRCHSFAGIAIFVINIPLARQTRIYPDMSESCKKAVVKIAVNNFSGMEAFSACTEHTIPLHAQAPTHHSAMTLWWPAVVRWKSWF